MRDGGGGQAEGGGSRGGAESMASFDRIRVMAHAVMRDAACGEKERHAESDLKE